MSVPAITASQAAAAAASPKPATSFSSPGLIAILNAKKLALMANMASASFNPVPSLLMHAQPGGANIPGAAAAASTAAIVLPVAKKAIPSPAPTASPAKATVTIGGGDINDLDGDDSAFVALPLSSAVYAAAVSMTQRTPEPPTVPSPTTTQSTAGGGGGGGGGAIATPAAAFASAAGPLAPAPIGNGSAAATTSAPKRKPPGGVMGTPCDYHYAEFFDTATAKQIKKFAGKKLHSIVLTPDFRGDISEVRASKIPADENGNVHVKRRRVGNAADVTDRTYALHAAPNPKTGVNRLYPTGGDGIITMTGAELVTHFNAFLAQRQSVHQTTFRSYLSTAFKPKAAAAAAPFTAAAVYAASAANGVMGTGAAAASAATASASN